MTRVRGQHGFSMGELIVVVAIIAVLGAIGTPMLLSALQASKVQAGAEEVAAALNGARQLALDRNESVCVTIPVAANALEYRPGTCGAAPFTRVRLANNVTVATAQNVTFTYLGAATPAATMYTVTNPEDGRTLSVSVSTSGRVRVGP